MYEVIGSQNCNTPGAKTVSRGVLIGFVPSFGPITYQCLPTDDQHQASLYNDNKEIGKIVQYNDVYYRAKVNHTSTDIFDDSKYTKLPRLPEIGGVNAKFRKRYERLPSQLDYGTIFPDVQTVVDFLLGYEKHMIDEGFVFDYFNKQTEAIENWKLINALTEINSSSK